jgi:hypothetical protein
MRVVIISVTSLRVRHPGRDPGRDEFHRAGLHRLSREAACSLGREGQSRNGGKPR